MSRRPALAAVAVAALAFAAPAAGGGPPATLTAHPNPAPSRDGVGATEVRWTSSAPDAAVFVADGRGAPRLFAAGGSGRARVPWLRAGVVYRFSLRAGGAGAAPLARVDVRTASADKPSAAIPAVVSDTAFPLGQRLVVRPSARVVLLGVLCALVFAAHRGLRRRGRARTAGRVAAAGALAAALVAVLMVLADPAVPLAQQAFPDTHEYADAARNLARGEGYVTTVHYDVEQPPRYPPGYSVALAPFERLATFPDGVLWGARLLAALAVLAAVASAWALGGALAGMLAAALMGVSPFFHDSGSLVLTDALAAGLTVGAVALAARPSPRRTAAAGLVAGVIVATRLALAVVPLALLVALPRGSRLRFALFAAPPVAALLAYQWHTFGSPLETGYDFYVSGENFAPGHVTADDPRSDGPWIYPDVLNGRLLESACPCPLGGPQSALSNLLFYPAALLGLFWVLSPPLATLPGLVWAVRRRADVACRAALLVVAGVLAVSLPYFYQATRFLAPATTLLLVLTGVAVARALDGSASDPSPARAAGPRLRVRRRAT